MNEGEVPAPCFSIVIPTHDRPEFLSEAIDSVLAQTVQDFEIIVVDDASEPPVTPHLDDRVIVVRRGEAGGPASARNTGAEHATGTYLTFLDDDDWYLPERLELALGALERAPLTLCWGGYRGEEVTARPVYEGDASGSIAIGFSPGACVAALRRDRFRPFDESFSACEDVDWWIRMVQENDVATAKGVGYLVRRHDEVRGPHGNAARLEGSRLLLEKHSDYFAHNRRAKAFRLLRISAYESAAGRPAAAAGALVRSLVARPSLSALGQAGRLVGSATTRRPTSPSPSQSEPSQGNPGMEPQYYSSERADMLPFVPSVGSFLDLGCGEGRFGASLKQRDPSAVVWGVEPSAVPRERAIGRLDRVIGGTFPECLPELDRTFDCVVCNDVLEHMYDPWSACEVIADLLSPGGTLVVSIPNIRNFATLLQLTMKGRWDYVDAGVLDRTHLRFFTPSTMREMVEERGFRVESLTGSWPLVTAKMRLIYGVCRVVAPSLGREGRFRQYVMVARVAG